MHSRDSSTRFRLTEAVTSALRERLDRLRQPPPLDIVSRLDRLSLEYSRLPVRDSRSADEILGYDEAGLPG